MGFQLNGACRELIKSSRASRKDGCGNIWQLALKIPHKSPASLYPSRRYFQSVCGISPFLCRWERITQSKGRKMLPFPPFFFFQPTNMVLIRNFVLLPSSELLLVLCGVLNCPDAGLFGFGNYFVLFYPCFGFLLIVMLVFWFVVMCFGSLTV